MKKILVVEDDAAIRLNVTLMLKGEGYTVDSAEDGRVGIEHAKSFAPDLIVSDVMMPELDGFGMLEALRADAHFVDTPFIFLTALSDRNSMRHGMNLGADDFLNKPFTRDELVDAVNSRLKKYENATRSLVERLVAGNDELRRWYRQSLTGGERERPLAFDETAGMTGRMTVATVLFADIRNFTTYSERLTAGQIAELLNAYFESVCQPIVRNGGRIAKLIGDGIMVVFAARDGDGENNHARRAIRAGLGIVLAANKFGEWFNQHFEMGGLPEFATGVGIHTGELMEVRIGPPGAEDLTVVGDSVNVASRLEGQTKELGWPVVASAAAIGMAGSLVSTGETRHLELRGRNAAIEAMEVTGIGAAEGASEGPIEVPASVRAALAENAQMTARAAKAALSETLRIITSELSRALAAGRPLQVNGYRVQKKIGEGGMSNVFLAERESDGTQVALKILNARPSDDKQLLQRFIQESALIYRPSQRGQDFRQGFHRRICLYRDGVFHRRQPEGRHRRRPDSAPGAVAAGAGRRGSGGNPSARHSAPRRQARKHDAARRRHHGAGRFRHRQTLRGVDGQDRTRRVLRYPLLHFAGAGQRQAGDRALGHLQPGHHLLRVAREPAAVQR